MTGTVGNKYCPPFIRCGDGVCCGPGGATGRPPLQAAVVAAFQGEFHVVGDVYTSMDHSVVLVDAMCDCVCVCVLVLYFFVFCLAFFTSSIPVTIDCVLCLSLSLFRPPYLTFTLSLSSVFVSVFVFAFALQCTCPSPRGGITFGRTPTRRTPAYCRCRNWCTYWTAMESVHEPSSPQRRWLCVHAAPSVSNGCLLAATGPAVQPRRSCHRQTVR